MTNIQRTKATEMLGNARIMFLLSETLLDADRCGYFSVMTRSAHANWSGHEVPLPWQSMPRSFATTSHARHKRRYALGIAVATPDKLHAANDIAVQFYVYRPRTRAAGGVCHLIHS